MYIYYKWRPVQMRRLFGIIPAAVAAIVALLLVAAYSGSILKAQGGPVANDTSTFEAPQLRPIPADIQQHILPLNTTAPNNVRGTAEKGYLTPGAMRTPDEFLAAGGNGVIIIKPQGQTSNTPMTVDVKIGSQTTIPLQATYKAGNSPPDQVKVQATGITSNFYIPSAIANLTTPEQRADEIQRTGKISGALDLSSTISFSPQAIILKPGESQIMNATIIIPAVWPKAAVGDTLLYDFAFTITVENGKGDVVQYRTPIQVHIAG
jgi:hypothetical protein